MEEKVMVYSIWEGYIEEVTAKAEKIIAKCNKYGCEYRFEILDTESFRKTEDGEIVRYVDVLLEGVARVGNWELSLLSNTRRTAILSVPSIKKNSPLFIKMRNPPAITAARTASVKTLSSCGT